MKKVLFFFLLIGILCGIIAYQQGRLKKFRSENKSLNTNISTLMEGVHAYKTKDSLHAAGIGILELRLSEYKKLRQEDVQLIEDLKIRLKRAEKISSHAMESNYQIMAAVRDTLFVYQNQTDTIRHFDYHSPYIDLKGSWQEDSIHMELTSYDTLLQVVHRIPKQFLFIRYGTKSLRQEVVSKNPHTKITYTEYIELRNSRK